MARGYGSIDVSTALKQVVKISNVFTSGRHAVSLCHHMQCSKLQTESKVSVCHQQPRLMQRGHPFFYSEYQ